MPGAMRYPYKPILDEGPILILPHEPETVIAEKFEAIVRGGNLNGRARGFYGIILMLRPYSSTLDWEQLGSSIRATAVRRSPEGALLGWRQALERVRTSRCMLQAIWAPYAKVNPCASDVTIDDAVDACGAIGMRVGL